LFHQGNFDPIEQCIAQCPAPVRSWYPRRMTCPWLLVGNPTARSGRAAARIDAALAGMRARGLDTAFLSTAPGGATVGLVADAIDAGGVETVVYLGGDGTFAEVAKGVLAARRRVRMGMLPSGTANDQGQSFGIASHASALDENLDLLVAGYTIPIDVGQISALDAADQVVHQDLFFDSAGFGMSPSILFTRNRDREWVARLPLLRDVYRDQLVYAGAWAQELLRSYVEPVKFTAEVRWAGGTSILPGLTDLVINNTAIYGGLWVPARRGAPDDGEMELVPLHGRRDMIGKAIRDLKDVPIWQEHLDLLGIPAPEGFSASWFDVLLLHPEGADVRSQVDGEEWRAGQHFRVDVLPRRLPLVVRGGWTPPWRPAHPADL
jgi:diacylglycerol kinase family enzyme